MAHRVPYEAAFARRYVAAARDDACVRPDTSGWCVRHGLIRTRLLVWLLLTVWVANLCDLLLTLRAVSLGQAIEANRLMAPVLHEGSLVAALVKIGVVTAAVVLLWALRRRRLVVPATAAVTLAFSALVVYEALSLLRG